MSECAGVEAEPEPEENEQPQEEEKGGGMGILPVSYTHLDVYKRQAQTGRSDGKQRRKNMFPALRRYSMR